MEHWECQFCKARNYSADPDGRGSGKALTPEDVCWKCKRKREDSVAAKKAIPTEVPASETSKQVTVDADPKYPALRTISTLLSVVAVLVLVVCIVAGIVLFANIKGVPGFTAGALVGVLGLVFWLFLKAAAESLVVLVDIERNTRVAATKVAGHVLE